MNKNVYVVGFVLFIITMLIFFGMYFFGMNVNYFNNSMLINAFVFPLIYTFVAFFSVNSAKKQQNYMSFRNAFGRAFKPMFLGGLLSILFMYFFLNFVDSDAKNLLNYQYVERQKSELNKEYQSAKKILAKDQDQKELDEKYRERLASFSPEMVKDKDMFTFRQFSYYFAAILVFYVILSTFFGSFFRSRIPENS